MSTNMTNILSEKTLKAIFKGESFSYDTVYLSLHDGDPTEQGLHELDYEGYERKPMTPEDWEDSSDDSGNFRLKSNTEVVWESLPGKTITHIGVWDSSEGGEILWISKLISNVYVPDGNAFRLSDEKLIAEFNPSS